MEEEGLERMEEGIMPLRSAGGRENCEFGVACEYLDGLRRRRCLVVGFRR